MVSTVAALASEREGRAPRVLTLPQDRLVAVARLGLAAVSLLAIYLDPLQPARNQPVAYGILVAYLLFALLALVRAIRRGPAQRGYFLLHLVDMAAIGSLMFLTEGSTSPFFVFMSFILLTATLRWGWRGALATGAVLTLFYGGMTVGYEIAAPAGEESDVDRIVVRTFYLLVASGLFAYFGAYRERSRERLAMLAAWPPAADPDAPTLRAPLAQAAAILGVPRIVVAWEQAEEPFVEVAARDGSGYTEARLAPDAYPGVADLLLDPRIFHVAAGGPELETGARAFLVDYAATPCVTAPFSTDRFRGRIFLVDCDLTSSAERSLAAIVAARIGSELEQHQVRLDMREKSAAEERMRLARQLHDGMLQSVTAARLQIVLASGQVDGEVKLRIEQVSELLGDEQRQIREFVDALGPARRSAGDP